MGRDLDWNYGHWTIARRRRWTRCRTTRRLGAGLDLPDTCLCTWPGGISWGRGCGHGGMQGLKGICIDSFSGLGFFNSAACNAYIPCGK